MLRALLRLLLLLLNNLLLTRVVNGYHRNFELDLSLRLYMLPGIFNDASFRVGMHPNKMGWLLHHDLIHWLLYPCLEIKWLIHNVLVNHSQIFSPLVHWGLLGQRLHVLVDLERLLFLIWLTILKVTLKVLWSWDTLFFLLKRFS